MKREKILDITAVIPAAGKPTNKIIYNSNLPDAMIPINGKPVIGYIVEDLISRCITNIVIILSSNDKNTEKYVTQKYGERCNLEIVFDKKHNRGLGYAMFLASKHIKNKQVLVCLGDTIYKGPLSFKKSFLITTNKYDDCQKWCFVEKNKDKFRFINKPQVYNDDGRVICGVYHFRSAKKFKTVVATEEKKKMFLDMHDVLEPYSRLDPFELRPAKKWYDCGNIENYYQAKIDFLRLRGFNSIKYNDLFGVITKTGIRSEKIKKEINWYQNLPDQLKIFTPRLINFSVGKDRASYSLEYYGYQSLDDIFIFGYLDERIWDTIIAHLLDIIDIFKKEKKVVPFSDYKDMYGKKIFDRIDELKKQNLWWSKILSFDKIIINKKEYRNVSYFIEKIKKVAKSLYSKKEMGLVHGDLCLNNILFDPGSRLFKFIDPRGNFGKQVLHGDVKYDLAKLRFSLVGNYDFIVSDLFKVSEGKCENEFCYNNYSGEYHDRVGQKLDKNIVRKGYDLNKIKTIEALLFLSVIPHHYDYPERQKAMFLTAIRLLNEVF